MYGIMLVNEAGETVASVGWENLEADVTMLGGFLSAIQMFSKNIAGDVIEQLEFGDMKLLIGNSGEYHVVTLHEANEKNAEDENRTVTQLVSENNGMEYNDGFLSLIKEMLSQNNEAKEKVDKSVKEWTENEGWKSLKSAKDWGNTVF
ncbi:MAG: hypothetical protein ACFFF4_11860 [Candidatus Thorarchaeota archaeon]